MKTALTPFQQQLQKLGFKRTYNYRARDPGERVQSYEMVDEENKVKLEVQLWGSGCHRVSHWKHTGKTGYGLMDTVPSEFTTVERMLKAIEFEKTRDAKGFGKDESLA